VAPAREDERVVEPEAVEAEVSEEQAEAVEAEVSEEQAEAVEAEAVEAEEEAAPTASETKEDDDEQPDNDEEQGQKSIPADEEKEEESEEEQEEEGEEEQEEEDDDEQPDNDEEQGQNSIPADKEGEEEKEEEKEEEDDEEKEPVEQVVVESVAAVSASSTTPWVPESRQESPPRQRAAGLQRPSRRVRGPPIAGTWGAPAPGSEEHELKAAGLWKHGNLRRNRVPKPAPQKNNIESNTGYKRNTRSSGRR
jgi:hypothetical protein